MTTGQQSQPTRILTVDDAIEELRQARVSKVRDLPRHVYRHLVKLGLVMAMESTSDPLLLTGPGLARLREARQVDFQQGRKNQESRSR